MAEFKSSDSSQTPSHEALVRALRSAFPELSASTAELLNDSEAAHMLGLTEFGFKTEAIQALLPAPVVLGPRTRRWARSDLLAAIPRLPRQQSRPPMPAELLRSKIQRLKGVAA